MRTPRVAFAVLAVTAAVGCTNTGLHRDIGPPDPPHKDTVNVDGTFCTEDPSTLKFPVKIWFAIDDTGSMQNNDPNMARYTAAIGLANALVDTSGSIYYGGIVFADTGASPTRDLLNPVPPYFTNNKATFIAAIQATQNPGNGGTPYIAPLNITYSDILQDIQTDPVIAKRTRYVIIFLSDGQPTDGAGDQAYYAAVDQIYGLRSQAGDVTLNTVLLGGSDPGAGPRLMEMAVHGHGIYKSFPNGDQLDYKDFDFSSIRRNFNQRFFMVSNLDAFPTGNGDQADSDGDGMPDYQESQVGTDPTKRDTDGDGCSDTFELRDAGWDPLIPGTQNSQCVCNPVEAVTDGDGDGLTDCEEKWMGTFRDNPDSDKAADDTIIGDLVPDGLDYTYLDNVLFPNDVMDYDADGVTDLTELRQHTDAAYSELDQVRQDWAYDYVYLNQEPDKPRCYDFEVDNIAIFHTLAATGHGASENDLELYFSESPQDDAQKEKSFRVAHVLVPMSSVGDTIHVTPDQFSTQLQATTP